MTRRNVQTLPPAVDIVGCCLPVRDICVIMREVFREGIQFVIVFSFNISHYILCLLTCLMLPFELIWCCNSLWLLRATSLVIFWSEEFFMCFSFWGFRNFFFSLSAVQGFCLCFHLKIFHSTIAICYHSQFYMSIIYSSHYILILGFCVAVGRDWTLLLGWMNSL